MHANILEARGIASANGEVVNIRRKLKHERHLHIMMLLTFLINTISRFTLNLPTH